MRNLSIVTRQLASKVTDRTERNRMIEESIQYAKQAVELDVKDGASWCKKAFLLNHLLICHFGFPDTLANSYVCFYFMVENHPKNLKQAFSAYNLAVSLIKTAFSLCHFHFGLISSKIQHRRMMAIYITAEEW